VTDFDSGDISVGNGSGDSLTDNGSGSYVATINATSDGQVTVDIPTGVAQDQLGNDSLAADTFSITVDSTITAPGEPDLAASSDTGSFDDDDVTDDGTPRFTGTCEQGATVTLTSSLDGDLSPTGICSGGTYDITITSALSEGAHEITASQVDQAGNSSPDSSTLRVEIVIPTLTVNVVGNVLTDNVDSSGGTPDPGALDCPAGGTCTATFGLEADVTLTATLDPASSFAGWSDECAAFGTDLSGTLTLDADKTCTATFASPEMDVEGNSTSIADGDDIPDSIDHTDFENVDVGTSFERTFTIQNEGDAELSLHHYPAAVTLSGSTDFMIVSQPNSGSIPAGGDDLTFTLRCTPSDSGVRKTTVSIANNDPDENPYNFDLACTGIVPEMDVQGNGTSISAGDTTPDVADGTDFGSANLEGGTVEHTFTIENSGLGELLLSGSPRVEITGAHTDDFTVTQSPDTPVTGSGGTTTFGITFDPSGLGQRTATVSITNNDSDENPYQFAIQGNGEELPEIVVLGNDQSIPAGDTTPDRGDLTDFGDVDESVGQVTHTFTIKNVGSADLNLDGGTPLVSISGTGAADFALATDATTPIAPGEETIFQITFDPSVRALRQATVSIANDDQDEDPYEFSIQGTGTDPAPEMEVQGLGVDIPDGDDSPTSNDNTDFGDAALNTTVQHAFVIRNTGSLELNLATTPAITIEGNHAADFSLTSDATTPVAASGGETSFEVSFTPSTAGLREATVSIANDDSDESLYTFAIQGAGSGTPAMDVQGNAVSIVNGDMSPDRKDLTDFGSVAVDGGAVSHTLIIKNNGTDDLALNGTPRIAISGGNAADFSIVAEPDSLVESNNNDVFIVQFDPSGAGLRVATVSIANDSEENPYTFAIQGTGTATGSGGEEDADGDGGGGEETGFKIGSEGGVFTHGPVKVLFPQLTLFIYEVDGPSSLGDNIRLGEDGRVFDIIVRDYRGNLVNDFDFPIGVCIKPTAAEVDAVGGNRHLLSVFHQHGSADWEVLDTFVDGEYVCATVNKLSLFGLGIPTLPETGFVPDMTVDLPKQPAEKGYSKMGNFRLEIPSLGLELPIVGVPLSEDGWDVRWLEGQAGWLHGTAFPTWVGNTAITAHVWDANNQPGSFVDLDTLQHGDEIVIHAWGLTHTYEVRGVKQVRPDDLRALPHEDYDVLTLLTCQGFDESEGTYDWRLVVRAVLMDVEAE
jgi:LPXTG-site transpeptidase (sortase) family protein